MNKEIIEILQAWLDFINAKEISAPIERTEDLIEIISAQGENSNVSNNEVDEKYCFIGYEDDMDDCLRFNAVNTCRGCPWYKTI